MILKPYRFLSRLKGDFWFSKLLERTIQNILHSDAGRVSRGKFCVEFFRTFGEKLALSNFFYNLHSLKLT